MEPEKQFAYLQKMIERSDDYQTFAIVYEDRQSLFLEGDRIDLNGRTYIEEAFTTGKTVLSDVLTSRLTGEPHL